MSGSQLHTVSVERHQITSDTIDISNKTPMVTEKILLLSSDLSVPKQKTANFTVCFNKKNVYYFEHTTKALHSMPILSSSSEREILDCFLSPCGLLLWVQFKLTNLQKIHFYSLIFSIPSHTLICTYISQNRDQYNNTISISENSKHVLLVENGNFNVYKVPQHVFEYKKVKTRYLVDESNFGKSVIGNKKGNVYYFDEKMKCNEISNEGFFKFEIVKDISSRRNKEKSFKNDGEFIVTVYEDYNYKFDLEKHNGDKQINSQRDHKNNNNYNRNHGNHNSDSNNNYNSGSNGDNGIEDIAGRRLKAFEEYRNNSNVNKDCEIIHTNANSNGDSNSDNNNHKNNNVVGGAIHYFKFNSIKCTLTSLHKSTNTLVCRANSDYFKHSIFSISSSPSTSNNNNNNNSINNNDNKTKAPIKFILFTQTSKTMSKSLKYYDSTSADLYLLTPSSLTHCLEISEFISLSAINTSFVIVYGILPNTQTNVYNLTKSQRFKKESLDVTEVSDCYMSNCNKVACFFGSGNLGRKLKFYEYGKEKVKLGESKHIGTRKLQWSRFNSNYLLTAALYPFRRVDNGINVWKYNGEKVVFIEKKDLLDCDFVGPAEVEKIGKVEAKQVSNKKMSTVPGLDALNKFLK